MYFSNDLFFTTSFSYQLNWNRIWPLLWRESLYSAVECRQCVSRVGEMSEFTTAESQNPAGNYLWHIFEIYMTSDKMPFAPAVGGTRNSILCIYRQKAHVLVTNYITHTPGWWAPPYTHTLCFLTFENILARHLQATGFSNEEEILVKWASHDTHERKMWFCKK